MMERFWRKVEKTDTCWLWLGAQNGVGYGRLRYQKTYWLAHRFAYTRLVGPIPEGMTIDHLCRVRNCVNPAHLEPVSHRENVLRGIAPSALNAVKTHCPQGHEYTAENTYTSTRGKRVCRACHRIRNRKAA